ncbi:hypothetical protein BBI01_06675 [Chryseobacterium artocarpi]|uniref:Peptidase S9 prolyl oligopeptidase catalytic domain-containing protein n=2 Tax=Chryseobacterium artocarpi TaxID=1414727 RepID=A0A1B8ZXQ7_9FLAO|nr:hypothetical protein BBI01_06675 [Chryseobacterium artocarpi]
MQGQQHDTLDAWYSKFSRLKNLTISSDQRWLAAKRTYYSATNNDTVIVIDTHHPKEEVQKFTVFAQPTFLNDNGIMGKDRMNRFTFLNLKSKKKIVYDNINMAFSLQESERYALLDNNSRMTLYSRNGDPIYSDTDIGSPYATDQSKKLFACKKESENFEVLDLSGNRPKKILSATDEIQDLILPLSGKYLFIFGKKQVHVYDCNLGYLKDLELPAFKDNRYKITEMSEAGTYLIESVSVEPRFNNNIVDVWYGNESDLKNRNRKINRRYWIWRSVKNLLEEIPTDKFPEFSAIGSERYLFAYHPTSGHNYVHWLPQYKIYLYDMLLKTYRFIGDFKGMEFGSPDIYFSPTKNGYFIGSEDGKSWSLFNLNSDRKKLINNKEGLHKPVFTSDGKSILFEGSDDIIKYDISKSTVQPLDISSDKKVRVLNYRERMTGENKNFYVRTVDAEKPLLCEIIDTLNGTTKLIEWLSPKKEKQYVLTKNKLDVKLADARSRKAIYVLEENTTMSPSIFKYSDTGDKELIYEPISKMETEIKKEIVDYTNSMGNKLRGVLYYPVSFRSDKKYPMIVHLYQIQSNAVNRYLMPEYEYYGFNVRTLLKRGYFVFLPDITYDSRGTGIAALDCVNTALDAISNHPNIEHKKIGLIGHSHGGYETNFIATHSDRFATYISGSGNSDLIRSYFSYNYNFNSPFYWQFENGQYEMKIPFSENKNLYLSNSPILNVEKVNAPILLWAGKKDENIAWDQVMEFYIGLRRTRKSVIALFYPSQGHGMSFKTEEIKDLTRRNLEWWDYFLKSKTDVDWIDKQIKEVL